MRRSALVLQSLLLAACGQSIPTFPGPPVDSGIECTQSGPPMTPVDAGAIDGAVAPHDAGAPRDAGPGLACAMGKVCLVGHCYLPCTMDAQCGDNESCTAGVCVGHVPHDMGIVPVDLGPPDMGRCGSASCTDPTPACNPTTGGCVECAAPDGCPGVAAPACDLAQGVCRPFVAAVCAPCRATADCAGAVPGFTAECVMHSRPYEKVCLAVCGAGGTCPYGQRCDTDNHCIPNLGSCTSWHAAAAGRACTMDSDCAPLGATGADYLYPGICNGTNCVQPCGLDTDCQSAGQTCPTGTVCM